MTRRTEFVLYLTILVLSAALAYTSQAAAQEPPEASEPDPELVDEAPGIEPSGFVPDEVLVKFRPGSPSESHRALQAEESLREAETFPGLGAVRLKIPEHATVGEVLQRLRRNPNVEYAEPNYVSGPLEVPNDPYYPARQWNLQRVQADLAWDITQGSPSVILAIADSGITATHPDLGLLAGGANFGEWPSALTDEYGHGTIVAGLAACRTGNGLGVACLGRGSSLMPLRIAGADGFSDYGKMAAAILYAADHGARVVNLSYGGTAPSDVLRDAIDYAWTRGTVVVAAAGNSNVGQVAYPAAYPKVVGVGATDGADVKSNFSNYGAALKVVAPGSGVFSTNKEGSYGGYFGTSFAAPQVAGLIGLLFAANPGLTPQNVLDILATTSEDLGAPGWDETYGFGRINAYRAVSRAREQAGSATVPTITPLPTARFTPPPVPTATLTPRPTIAPSLPPTALPTWTPVCIWRLHPRWGWRCQ
jgi:thermitase